MSRERLPDPTTKKNTMAKIAKQLTDLIGNTPLLGT